MRERAENQDAPGRRETVQENREGTVYAAPCPRAPHPDEEDAEAETEPGQERDRGRVGPAKGPAHAALCVRKQ